MNTYKAAWIPILELAILGLILLAMVALGSVISIAEILKMPTDQAPVQVDPLNMVSAFHSAVNRKDVDAILVLLADDATINDDGNIIQGRQRVRNWISNSHYMTGLQIQMVHSQITGEKVFWKDLAHNGRETQERSYLLRWTAVIQNGKIKSLTVSLLPMPDGK